MSATTSVMMMMFLITVASVTATTAAVIAASVASAAAAFTAEHTYHSCHLVIRGFPVGYYLSYEMQVLSCTRMIEVDGNCILLHLDDGSVEPVAVLALEWYDVAFKNMFFVKLAVDAESGLRYVEHEFVLKLSVCLFAWDYEIKNVSCLQWVDFLFKCRKYAT